MKSSLTTNFDIMHRTFIGYFSYTMLAPVRFIYHKFNFGIFIYKDKIMELRKFIATTIREYLNENVNNITFKKSVDEDRTTITAYINNNKVGSLSMEFLFDAYQYEFEDVFDEDTFDEMYPDSEIVKIEHIEVDDNYKNSGIGSELMKHGMELMKKNGYNQFYLNASPMGFKGLNTMDLVNFYKKFGFKELLNQGHNVLMGVVF